MRSAWLHVLVPRCCAAVRLICFPYAGGSASVFRLWPAALPSDLELCAVQLPGRAQRLDEALVANMPALVEAVVDAIAPYCDVPFAFFGHSMGALLASEVARDLAAKGLPQPGHLIVSARRPPRVPDLHSPLSQLSDAEFVAEIDRRYGGIPHEILESPEVLALLLPALRADIAALEGYQPTQFAPLDCPVTAMGGANDPLTPRSHLEAWRNETVGPFRLRLFAGGHFYIDPQRASLLTEVAAIVRSIQTSPKNKVAAE